MTYDDWKLRSDRDEYEIFGLNEWFDICDECEHHGCDCPCCNEPEPEE